MRTPGINPDDLAHNDESSSRGGLLFGHKHLKQLHGLGPQASRSIDNDVFVSRAWLNDAGAHMTARNER
jgi:hypothetical protein